jgi:hypothetical protein
MVTSFDGSVQQPLSATTEPLSMMRFHLRRAQPLGLMKKG